MKIFILKIQLILLCANLFSQPPQTCNYQAVLRDASGKIRANENIDIEVSIIQGTADGTPEYTESHSTETNAHGLVNLKIGEGVTTDDFSTIEWSNGPFFISINVNGLNMGTSQLLSVPYALHAETAHHMENPPEENDPVFTSSIAAGITANDTASWNSKLDSYTETDPVFNSWNKDYDDLNNIPSIADTINTYVDGSETIINAGENISVEGSGTKDSPYVIASSGSSLSGHFVGELFGGGIVFWVTPDGQHGLVASLDDLDDGTGVAWSNVTDVLIGETAQSMTDGKSNSLAIIAQDGHTNSAAKLCADYRGGGFDDWYLPSALELRKIEDALLTISHVLSNDGNNQSYPLNPDYESPTFGQYWSSTEELSHSAWINQFGYGPTMKGQNKSDSRRIRAIRSF